MPHQASVQFFSARAVWWGNYLDIKALSLRRSSPNWCNDIFKTSFILNCLPSFLCFLYTYWQGLRYLVKCPTFNASVAVWLEIAKANLLASLFSLRTLAHFHFSNSDGSVHAEVFQIGLVSWSCSPLIKRWVVDERWVTRWWVTGGCSCTHCSQSANSHCFLSDN